MWSSNLRMDPMLRKFTSSPSRMIEWKAEIEIQYLQPDGIEVCFFSDLVDGGQYRAVCKSDDRKYHDQVEDALECPEIRRPQSFSHYLKGIFKIE